MLPMLVTIQQCSHAAWHQKTSKITVVTTATTVILCFFRYGICILFSIQCKLYLEFSFNETHWKLFLKMCTALSDCLCIFYKGSSKKRLKWDCWSSAGRACALHSFVNRCHLAGLYIEPHANHWTKNCFAKNELCCALTFVVSKYQAFIVHFPTLIYSYIGV